MANTTVPAELVSNSVYERKNLIINGAMQVAQLIILMVINTLKW